MNIYAEHTNASPEIYSLNNVSRAFGKGKDELQVLSDVDLTLREGEIVGMLGRSGSGKSTLLRIIAGLIQPSTGEVRYNGSLLTGPAAGVAMVFQTFALFPWLTVLENVEAGLQALQVERKAARKRTQARAGRDRPDWPRWVRKRLSPRTVGRDAPTRGLCPRLGG
jgi:NitT/TauT family transport system ATP-binding protein